MINPFEESLLTYTDLVRNNVLRINNIAQLTHRQLSKFDSYQLKELSELDFGRGLLVLANRYAHANEGLRRFDEWIDEKTRES